MNYESEESKIRKQSAAKMLDEAYNDGFINGLSLGYAAAERIMIWYSANHKLEEPESMETLKEWSMKELDKLKERMIEAKTT